jgi:hypothetical protein
LCSIESPVTKKPTAKHDPTAESYRSTFSRVQPKTTCRQAANPTDNGGHRTATMTWATAATAATARISQDQPGGPAVHQPVLERRSRSRD